MNANPLRPVESTDVETFDRDGVVFLPGMFDREWIELLRAGLETNRAHPTTRSRIWDRDAEGRTMFYDSQAWQGVDEYREFVFESPAAKIAADLMRATTVNFFFDAVFVRSPGTQFSTPWHQDEPYWSVDGFNTCSIWMPLVPVAAKNALSFVPRSHRSATVFDQYNFGDLNPDGQSAVDMVDFGAIAEDEFPDIDADPERWGVVNWDMEPGDCIAFNSRMMHGGSGQLPDDVGLEVFTTKWLGDDVSVIFRECGMDPDHTEVMKAAGLKPGDRPEGELYPRILTR
ncbi:MAG: hypothetical protein EX269_02290 [Acidimicrobiales bacterium]|nr:MAG: hypothetical protein EX269_02290 [Acidimicrobiales bacterium]